MTPSGWHDAAHSRDAGHDELQLAVWRFFGRYGQQQLSFQEGRETSAYDLVSLAFEKEFVVAGKIVAFADICEIFHDRSQQRYYKMYLRLYEIKPKISSVGAVVRQCKAMKVALHAWRYANEWSSTVSAYSSSPIIKIIPVCLQDDPKLEMLAEVWDTVYAWNGTCLSRIERP